MITTKLLKFSPLMVVVIALAVCGTIVGATIALTSNTSTSTPPTVIASGNGVITVSLGAPSYATVGTGLAGDSAGVNYAIYVNTTQAISDVNIIITLTGPGAVGLITPSAQSVSITNYAYGTPNTNLPAHTVMYTIALPNQGIGESVYNLNIVYNTAGSYGVSASETGTAA